MFDGLLFDLQYNPVNFFPQYLISTNSPYRLQHAVVIDRAAVSRRRTAVRTFRLASIGLWRAGVLL